MNDDKPFVPVFGPNGAVMNAPTMTDELRAKYEGKINGETFAQNPWSIVHAGVFGLCLAVLLAASAIYGIANWSRLREIDSAFLWLEIQNWFGDRQYIGFALLVVVMFGVCWNLMDWFRRKSRDEEVRSLPDILVNFLHGGLYCLTILVSSGAWSKTKSSAMFAWIELTAYSVTSLFLVFEGVRLIREYRAWQRRMNAVPQPQ